jgi:GNAT superfamily N-acetyltransferase
VDFVRLEEVALNAWPALRQLLCDGWVLRFADGYTKRANSANPLYPSRTPLDEQIAWCERCYAEQRQPAIFRLTSCLAPPALDATLERHGLQLLDPSLVMTRDLRDPLPQPAGTLTLHFEEDANTWLDLYDRLSGQASARHNTHHAILQAIQSRRYLCCAVVDDQVVGCGLAVLENQYVGLFDIVIEQQQRGQGYGTKMVAAMLDWARGQGAAWAYLQVVAANAPARHVYEKLGFREAYRYWYRVPG